MIRVLLVPSSDYLGHPFPQRHNQIFERLHDGKEFEVHVVRFPLYAKANLETDLVVHEFDVKSKTKRSVVSFYARTALRHAFEIRRIIRDESIDVVVLANLASPFGYLLLRDLLRDKTPVVFDFQDFYPTSATGYVFNVYSVPGKVFALSMEMILREIIKRSTVVTCASYGLMDYAKHINASRVVYVPNGISEIFKKVNGGGNVRKQFSINDGDLVIGYIGSVEFWTDMQSLIDGIALAKKKRDDLRLFLVGKGLQTDYPKRVKGWLKARSLKEQTVWTDFIPHEEVPKFISAFDICTIPFDVHNQTAYYAAPNKLWEYLSQMKPVMATPIPEILKNREHVTLVSNARGYAESIKSFNKEKIDSDKLLRARTLACNHSWQTSVDLMSDVFRDVTKLDAEK